MAKDQVNSTKSFDSEGAEKYLSDKWNEAVASNTYKVLKSETREVASADFLAMFGQALTNYNAKLDNTTCSTDIAAPTPPSTAAGSAPARRRRKRTSLADEIKRHLRSFSDKALDAEEVAEILQLMKDVVADRNCTPDEVKATIMTITADRPFLQASLNALLNPKEVVTKVGAIEGFYNSFCQDINAFLSRKGLKTKDLKNKINQLSEQYNQDKNLIYLEVVYFAIQANPTYLDNLSSLDLDFRDNDHCSIKAQLDELLQQFNFNKAASNAIPAWRYFVAKFVVQAPTSINIDECYKLLWSISRLANRPALERDLNHPRLANYIKKNAAYYIKNAIDTGDVILLEMLKTLSPNSFRCDIPDDENSSRTMSPIYYAQKRNSSNDILRTFIIPGVTEPDEMTYILSYMNDDALIIANFQYLNKKVLFSELCVRRREELIDSLYPAADVTLERLGALEPILNAVGCSINPDIITDEEKIKARGFIDKLISKYGCKLSFEDEHQTRHVLAEIIANGKNIQPVLFDYILELSKRENPESLNKKYQTESVNIDGWSFLRFAANNGRADLIRILRSHGCVVGRDELISASMSDKFETFEAMAEGHLNQIRSEYLEVVLLKILSNTARKMPAVKTLAKYIETVGPTNSYTPQIIHKAMELLRAQHENQAELENINRIEKLLIAECQNKIYNVIPPTEPVAIKAVGFQSMVTRKPTGQGRTR